MINLNWFWVTVVLIGGTGVLSIQMGFNALTWQYWVLLIIVGASNIAGFIEGFEK